MNIHPRVRPVLKGRVTPGVVVDYYEILRTEFSKETDRAAVILTGSIADELLRSLLAGRFVPVSSSSDELFDGANAPLGTFSSRIEMAYRLGEISVKFARDLHLIRKIRNEFAHNIHGCSFDDARVRSRITELSNSHGIIQRSPHRYEAPPSTRDQFLEAASWMIFHLNELIKETNALSPRAEEWGYGFSWPKGKEDETQIGGSTPTLPPSS
jgi:DNA-binding MltR family transcriptional regulator